MKLLCLLFFVLLTSSAWCQKQDTIKHFYKGKVNREFSITMQLKLAGNVCMGSYFYDKYRKVVNVEGGINDDNELILIELDDKGKKTSSVFKGTFSDDWKSVKGSWENKTRERLYHFDLKEIERPMGQKMDYRFKDILQFQELLNYFDLEPQLPFEVNLGTKTKGFRWKKSSYKSAKNDYQRAIPYRLARRFIMDKVRLKCEGAFNYFDIKKSNYKAHEMHYKSLCCVYRTASYVGLLLNFTDDTGWDSYNVTFLLLYDYAGHLLDACKVGKTLNLEQAGRQLVETANSRFLADSTIEMQSNRILTEYGKDQAGKEFFRETASERHIYYILQASGQFMRQEVDTGNTKK